MGGLALGDFNDFGYWSVPSGKSTFGKSISTSINRQEMTYDESYVNFVAEKNKVHILRKSGTLIEEIRREHASAEIDLSQSDVANRSADDAVQMVERLNLDGNPRVMQSSDGILTLEWRKKDEGLALIFAGDGNVGISIRQNGGFYECFGSEIKVTHELPDEIAEMLARMS